MKVNVSDKVVVITGSSRGIGKELIRAFANEKSKVVINYLHSEILAKNLRDDIIVNNPNCIMIKADITSQSDVSRMYHEIISEYGRVDLLINNAGICDDNPIQLMPDKQLSKVLDVNLTGTYLCCRAFSKIMIQQKRGKIINISSIKGQEGCEGQVNYSASKAGIIGFTKALAKELGKFNVAVNVICPGFIVTDLNRHNSDKEKIAKERSLLSIDTALTDVINFIIFIASDLFIGVSGRVFNLDSRIK